MNARKSDYLRDIRINVEIFGFCCLGQPITALAACNDCGGLLGVGLFGQHLFGWCRLAGCLIEHHWQQFIEGLTQCFGLHRIKHALHNLPLVATQIDEQFA